MAKKKFDRIALAVILIAIVGGGVTYWTYDNWQRLQNLELKSYSDFGQFATAVLATVAALLAAWQVFVQRELARQRTAFDFFFKTEMEEDLWTAYKASRTIFR